MATAGLSPQGALPPLPLKFERPNKSEPLEAQFTATLAGAAIRYFDAQGRVLVHIPLQVPELAKDGSFTLPPILANYASESGTVVRAALVDRVGEPLGIEGPVSGPDGGGLKVTKGQIVEFVWAAPSQVAGETKVSARTAAQQLHLDQVIALYGGLAQCFNKAGRVVAQLELHQRRPDENPPAEGAVWIDADTAFIRMPSRLRGELIVDLVHGDLIATVSVAATGAKPPLVLEVPLANYGIRRVKAEDAVVIVRRPDDEGQPALEEWLFDWAKISRRREIFNRRKDLGNLRDQVAAMETRLAELEGEEEE